MPSFEQASAAIWERLSQAYCDPKSCHSAPAKTHSQFSVVTTSTLFRNLYSPQSKLIPSTVDWICQLKKGEGAEPWLLK